MANQHARLAVLRELRPIAGNRSVEINQTAVGEH